MVSVFIIGRAYLYAPATLGSKTLIATRIAARNFMAMCRVDLFEKSPNGYESYNFDEEQTLFL